MDSDEPVGFNFLTPGIIHVELIILLRVVIGIYIVKDSLNLL